MASAYPSEIPLADILSRENLRIPGMRCLYLLVVKKYRLLQCKDLQGAPLCMQLKPGLEHSCAEAKNLLCLVSVVYSWLQSLLLRAFHKVQVSFSYILTDL